MGQIGMNAHWTLLSLAVSTAKPADNNQDAERHDAGTIAMADKARKPWELCSKVSIYSDNVNAPGKTARL